jgi:quercetin dioxygenase-like cupin family protein
MSDLSPKSERGEHLGGGMVRVVHMDDVEKIPLPGDSWSRMLITHHTAVGNRASLGYSVFRPASVTASVSHEVEEVAFVVQGQGELRLESGVARYRAGDALFIPPGTWHAVANTGETDVVMIFAFPFSDYPATERR